MCIYVHFMYIYIYILLSSISVLFSKRGDLLLILSIADDH